MPTLAISDMKKEEGRSKREEVRGKIFFYILTSK
jgi:hypothetical protein